jgi:hypothetical protein
MTTRVAFMQTHHLLKPFCKTTTPMKNIQSLQLELATAQQLDADQQSLIRGGTTKTTNDDKRRNRPGTKSVAGVNCVGG